MWLVDKVARRAEQDSYEVTLRHHSHGGKIIVPLPYGLVPHSLQMTVDSLYVLGADVEDGRGRRQCRIDLARYMKLFGPESDQEVLGELPPEKESCRECRAVAILTEAGGVCGYCEQRLFGPDKESGFGIKNLKLPLKQDPQPILAFSTPSWDDFA